MKILFICSLLISSMAVQTQSSVLIDVPASVLKTFGGKYPDAEDVSWRNDADVFIAEFYDFDGYIKLASFTNSGAWVETTTEFNVFDLPRNIQDYLSDNYEDLEDFDTITMVEQPEVVRYMVNFENEEEMVKLVFDQDGNLLDE